MTRLALRTRPSRVEGLQNLAGLLSGAVLARGYDRIQGVDPPIGGHDEERVGGSPARARVGDRCRLACRDRDRLGAGELEVRNGLFQVPLNLLGELGQARVRLRLSVDDDDAGAVGLPYHGQRGARQGGQLVRGQRVPSRWHVDREGGARRTVNLTARVRIADDEEPDGEAGERKRYQCPDQPRPAAGWIELRGDAALSFHGSAGG